MIFYSSDINEIFLFLTLSMKSYIKTKLEEYKPIIAKTVAHTAQGYLFGCMVGVFAHKKDIYKSMHSTGMTFAKVGLVYSSTESILEKVQGKNRYNNIAAGAITGIIVNGKRGVRDGFLSGACFGLYSGINDVYGKE